MLEWEFSAQRAVPGNRALHKNPIFHQRKLKIPIPTPKESWEKEEPEHNRGLNLKAFQRYA